MSLNSFAQLYEEATIDLVRHITQHTLDHHVDPIRSGMSILDLACGSGGVTRIIYEHCEARGIDPPRIVGVDIGPDFIEAFNANKVARGWAAEGFVGDASNLDMCADQEFDLVIMSFGIFAVKDEVADKVAAEIYRVLRPGGRAVFTMWRETWVERMFMGASAAVGRPQAEVERFKVGKWLLAETGRDTILAGGFAPDKVQHFRHDDVFPFRDTKEALDRFDTPFWKGIGTSTWTGEQKSRWRVEIEKLITSEEKAKGGLPANAWILVADK